MNRYIKTLVVSFLLASFSAIGYFELNQTNQTVSTQASEIKTESNANDDVMAFLESNDLFIYNSYAFDNEAVAKKDFAVVDQNDSNITTAFNEDPNATLVQHKQVRIDFETTEDGYIYGMVVPRGSTAPTKSQVIAQTSYSSVHIASQTFLKVDGGNDGSNDEFVAMYLTGLTPETDYDVYMVYTSRDGVVQAEDAYKLEITTTEQLGLDKDLFYIVAQTDDNEGSKALWASNGVDAPQMVFNLSYDVHGVKKHTVWNNKIYFSGRNEKYGRELWVYDGINKPYILKDINPGDSSSAPGKFKPFQNKLYFTAKTEDHGRELWVYDGVNEPHMVHDIYKGSDCAEIKKLVVFNNKLYFGAESNAEGEELWVYDGVNAPTVIDINPGSADSDPGNLVIFQNKLYFNAEANSTYGEELFVYDGVNAPHMVADINPGSADSYPYYFTVLNDKLYFRAEGNSSYGYELWAYDGTNDPYMVKDIRPGSGGSSPEQLAVFNDKLYFQAYDGIHGDELWAYDGINDPYMVADIRDGSSGSYPLGFKVFGDKLYFQADTYEEGEELFVYDGLNEPTLVYDFYAGYSDGEAKPSFSAIGEIVTSNLQFRTQPIVVAVDEFGNIDTDYSSGNIDLTFAGDGNLTGTMSASFVDGQAEFSGLKYTASVDREEFNLTATHDGSLGNVTSKNIVADIVATKLVFETQPASLEVRSGIRSSLETTPVIRALDDLNATDTDPIEVVFSDFNNSNNLEFDVAGDRDENSSLLNLLTDNGTITFDEFNLTYTNSSEIETFKILASAYNVVSATSDVFTSVVNHLPTFERNVSIVLENNNSIVLDLNVTDGNSDTMTFTLEDDFGGLFVIDSSTGVITVTDAFNYEDGTNRYDLNITVSDGYQYIYQNVTVNVQNVNDAPTIDLSDLNSTTLEDSLFSYNLNLFDEEGDELNITFLNKPDWLNLESGYGVTTFAGSGEANSTDGMGTSASFNFPIGIAVDENGTLFVTNYTSHKVRKITPDGNVTTFAGSGIQGSDDGMGTNASFNQPVGIAVDENGTLFVADKNSHKVRKITSDGNVTTFVSSLMQPYGIAIDGNGTLFVNGFYYSRIEKITPDGNVTTFAGSSSGSTDAMGTSASFNYPSGIAIDGNGTLFISEFGNDKIRKITLDGNVTTFAGSGSEGSADGMGTSASFKNPNGIAIDKDGNLFVADKGNHLIRKITPDGNVTTFAGSGSEGSDDGMGTNASFDNPNGIVIDKDGNFFITDSGNNLIRKIGANPVYQLSGTPTNDDVGDHTFTVVINDGNGSVTEQNITITVQNVNDIPVVDVSGGIFITVNENFASTVLDVNATDIDNNLSNHIEALTFGLSDDHGGLFAIDSSTGVISLTTPINYEDGTNRYDLNVSVSDGNVTVSQIFRVNIQNVNDAPNLTATESNSTFIENMTAVSLFTSPVISDEDVPKNDLIEMVITVENIADTMEYLTYNGEDINLTDGSSFTYTTFSYSVSVNGDEANITITDSNITESEISGIQYGSRSDNPTSSSITRDISIVSIKDNGGTENNGVDTNSLLNVTSTVTITPTNDLPTIVFASGTTITIDEDSQESLTFTLNDIDGDTVTPTVASATNGTATINGTTLEFTPDENFNGNATITVQIDDGSGDEPVNATINVTILAVDDAPELDSISDLTLDEDFGTHDINLSANDVEDDSFSYSATSSDESIVTVSISENVLTISSVTNANGTVTIDVNVTQDNNSSLQTQETFSLTVEPVNDAPTFETDLTDLVINEDTGSLSFDINISDIDADDLNLTISSNDNNKITVIENWTNLVQFADYDSENGNTLDFNLSTVENANGTGTEINISLSDGEFTILEVYEINITAVNDAPTFETNLALVSNINEDSGNLNFTIDVSDIDTDTLDLNITVSDDTLIELTPNWTNSVTSNETYDFNISTISNIHGSVDFNISLFDGEFTTSEIYTLSINSIDDTPVLDDIADVSKDEDFASFDINLSATDIENDSLIYSATSSDESLVTVSVLENILTVSSVADANGQVNITVKATQENNSSIFAEKIFEITINPVNDAPIIDLNETMEIDEDKNGLLNFTTSDIDGDEVTVSIVTNPKNGTIILDGDRIGYTPNINFYGTDNFVISITDGIITNEKNISISINVNSIDDIQVLEAISDVNSTGGNTEIELNLTDIDSDLKTVDYNVTSSDSTIATGEVIDGKLLIVSGSNSGTTTLTVSATVDGQTVSQTFEYSLDLPENPESNIFISDIEDISDIEVSDSVQNKTVSYKATSSYYDITSVVATSSSEKVTVTVNSENSELNLVIDAGFIGMTTIVVVATDSSGKSATARFNVTVNPSKAQICLSDLKNSLSFDDIKSNNNQSNYIRSDLDLIESKNICDTEYSISWKSSDENVISINGVVTIDESQDKTIQLIAIISDSDGNSIEKKFLFTVPKEEVTDAILVEHGIKYLTFNDIRNANLRRDAIYSDLTLVSESIAGTQVTWESNNTDLIAIDGTVTRTEMTLDENVKLEANITAGEESGIKEFILTVKAPKTDHSQIVNADKVWLSLANILGENRSVRQVKTDLNLHSNGINGSSINWTSSNRNVIELNGTVTRNTSVDSYVELQALISSGDINETKDFLVKVLKSVEDNTENNLTFESVEETKDENENSVIKMNLKNGEESVTSTVKVPKTFSDKIETVISDESVKTTIESENSTVVVYLNSDGTSENTIQFVNDDNESIETKLDVKVSGATTEVQEDGTIVLETANQGSAQIKGNGTTEFKLNNTVINSEVEGTSLEISETGSKTTHEKNVDGGVQQSAISTSNDETTKTAFTVFDENGGIKKSDSTLAENNSFGKDSEITMGENSTTGEVYMKATTTMEDTLEF